MDKELLRMVIFATGLAIMICIVVWAYIKNKQHRRLLEDWNEDGAERDDRPQSRSAIGDDDFLGAFDDDELKFDDFGKVRADKRYHDEEYDTRFDDEDELGSLPRFQLPSVLQFSVLANQEEGFNGLDLERAFDLAGLEYGSLHIYERLDDMRQVDFGVASMAPPGTFPEGDLDSYQCPGIVFFMQPGELDESAPAVFDDFVQTVKFVAKELDGSVLDHERKPLQEKTLTMIRRSL